MKLTLILALLLAPQQATVAPATPQEAPPSGPISVQTWVSQTAVWPGDPLEYSVRLDLAPRVQLPEDLTGDQMAWAPFRLIGFAQTEEPRPDGSRAVTLHYSLVAVDLPEGGAAAEIPPIRVSYVQLPERPVASDELAAEELVVTGPRIAFRSTLETTPEEATIRDGKELFEADTEGRTLLLLGAAGLLLGAVPFGRSAHAAAKRLIERRREVEARGQRRQHRNAVAALRTAPLRDKQDYERLYGGLFGALREHLEDEYEVPFAGLTSADSDALRRAGLPDPVVERITGFLSECEAVRYQGEIPPDAEQRARQAVKLLEEVVA